MAASEDGAGAGGAGGVLPPWLLRLGAHRHLLAPVGFVMLVIVLVLPLPAMLMDVLICFNIALAVVVLLTTIYMQRPLEFSVFPSLLLATTLLRLVLNVASTRLILSVDESSPELALAGAGKVIQAFGTFVAGDSLFVGIVIFLILIVVQFVVVTKGATRISEVAARFTLDAMPGKQMAIDADLSAGAINEGEARRRREEVRQEADFFGAMDGASKFVRGDAIAGIIITAVNVIGGFAVGLVEHGWPAAQTAEVFTKLTIGDGLTSQIPSFVVSIAAALIVTRSSSRAELGNELTDQLASQPRGLLITAAFLALLSLTPLPALPLLGTSLLLVGLAWTMSRQRARAAQARERQSAEPPSAGPSEQPIESLLKVDALELEVGYHLVALVDRKAGGTLLDRINAIRRQLAGELGVVMPPVRIRDNPQLAGGAYRLKIRGNTVGQGELRHDKLLAMDSGLASGKVEGERTKEPAFGLDAWWIEHAQRGRAESLDYTVVDPTSVLSTHLTELVRRHADELLSRDEVSNLVEGLKAKAPKLVEQSIPEPVKIGELHRVLQRLLSERVPIRDLETIVETLAEWTPRTRDLDVLTEYVRNALRRTICKQYVMETSGQGASLAAVALDPATEDVLAGHIDRGSGSAVVTLPARLASALATATADALKPIVGSGRPAVVIASPSVRAAVRSVLAPRIPGIVVLGYNEIEPSVELDTRGLVRIAEPALAA